MIGSTRLQLIVKANVRAHELFNAAVLRAVTCTRNAIFIFWDAPAAIERATYWISSPAFYPYMWCTERTVYERVVSKNIRNEYTCAIVRRAGVKNKYLEKSEFGIVSYLTHSELLMNMC